MDDEKGDVGHGCPFSAVSSIALERIKDYVLCGSDAGFQRGLVV